MASFLLASLSGKVGARRSKPKHIVVRSSWQTINIGDIAHTPGLLRLLGDFIPDCKVSLWASAMESEVREILQRRFPEVDIFTNEEVDKVETIFNSADFFLHGSGPFLVGRKELAQWREKTGKPYGVFGITFMPHRELSLMVDLMNDASFIYFRDSKSLEAAQEAGVKCREMAWGPDAAFATDIRDDHAAEEFLLHNDLETAGFVCVIPRYRYTPNWTIPSKNAAYNAEKDRVNQAKKEHDHLLLREAIIEIVSNTHLKVLICAEDVTQVQLGKEIIYDKLPRNIRKKVVWRPNYWLTDEALSTYLKSVGLFGLEMHSPIMCVGQGIPAIVGRFQEQTTKGFMWSDIGLKEWLFDMDADADRGRYVSTVLRMISEVEESKRKAMAARALVFGKFREGMARVSTFL